MSTKVGRKSGKTVPVVITNSRVSSIINEYRPFVPAKYQGCFDAFPSDDIAFINYLIFTVWFCSQNGISTNQMDFYKLYKNVKHVPYHSFLSHIRTHTDPPANFIIDL